MLCYIVVATVDRPSSDNRRKQDDLILTTFVKMREYIAPTDAAADDAIECTGL